ncbi:hypothetical protein A6E74_00075 [Enterococcus thailandicus]|uniref:Uncharacterized protein n=1 Tax=Enterococcus thailandicus TaxID=417368 RepID=A0A179EUF4_ENTTH|nr:hypothetical protein A6E74_00075 [Enterococcus thailandicus]
MSKYIIRNPSFLKFFSIITVVLYAFKNSFFAKGCGAKCLASSNKEAFLKIVFHIFLKRELIAKEVALGTP